METITSRQNSYIRHLRALGSRRDYREERREYLCDGDKLLREALAFGAEIRSILWRGEPGEAPAAIPQYLASEELFDYASPMKNSPGPLFCVAMPPRGDTRAENAILLETVQDPGNVGTVIRTANAFRIGAVVLCGACADLYHPKTVRSTMGAIFRQQVVELRREELGPWLRENGLTLYGAALSERAEDIRSLSLTHTAVAVGSEGKGLSRELLALCEKELIIPMNPDSESLNAAAAAAVIMWEMAR